MPWLDTLQHFRTNDFSRIPEQQRDEVARRVINVSSCACAVLAVSPIPFADALVMLPVQSTMVAAIGRLYGRKITRDNARDLILEVGATAGAGMLARQGIKLVLPVIGGLLTVPSTYAASWGIGRMAVEYFKNPLAVTSKSLKEAYENEKPESGQQLFGDRPEAQAITKDAAPKEKRTAKKVVAVRTKAPQPQIGVAKKAPRTRMVVQKNASQSRIARLVEEDFSARLLKHASVVKAIGAPIHFTVTGDGGAQWTIDCTRKKDWVLVGLRGTPKLEITTSAQSLVGLLDGSRNGQLAVLSGHVLLKPMNLEVAQELGKLFA